MPIENTSSRDPFVHFLGTMSDGSSDYITGMEAAGQRQFVTSEQMPTDAPIADLEALGFTFGPVDDRDPLFRPATLPAGWKRQSTDHAMHSDIVDDKGRRRVGIFYKAAFYDRCASAHIVHPTEPLADLMYADDLPASITLDDLLTAEVARDWLAAARNRANDDLTWMPEGSPAADRTHARLARLDEVEKLIDAAAAKD